ncbi:type II toxin-antitoxin system death-on-curing family toxin [Leptospira perolatii]|uniref:Type II toxin-antitoxin system death-on-curing family toxin n=1 Tax=Leptospira perolatii TaxID=2023191 RepID=A0A2M9ZN86_9LEPT|nr:type II toxin-antitoxin system death-on-curing family toxin [Leptospira perolatii]PJZ68907.1 type II toxin-antitoxin system death-on-curing family toxin [Leptospira perolatii]PJZ73474.1 type II toxin-antitoxin system death-on-curing family toxin [Leptospira perolatii]
MNNSVVRYLTLEEVLYIHANQIDEYGGSYGIRDQGLLESAISQPSTGFGDQEFHKELLDKAAAYLFYLCKNHPFIDGNKRVALAVSLVFLDLNGIELDDPEGMLYDLTIGVASGEIPLKSIAQELEKLTT